MNKAVIEYLTRFRSESGLHDRASLTMLRRRRTGSMGESATDIASRNDGQAGQRAATVKSLSFE